VLTKYKRYSVFAINPMSTNYTRWWEKKRIMLIIISLAKSKKENEKTKIKEKRD